MVVFVIGTTHHGTIWDYCALLLLPLDHYFYCFYSLVLSPQQVCTVYSHMTAFDAQQHVLSWCSWKGRLRKTDNLWIKANREQREEQKPSCSTRQGECLHVTLFVKYVTKIKVQMLLRCRLSGFQTISSHFFFFLQREMSCHLSSIVLSGYRG